jgi:uncharacterized protein YjbJ (UPF0337 family)
MNWSQIEGNWTEIKGKAKQAWGRLTDDELDTIAGKREELEAKIQKHYGLSKDVAQRNVDDWLERMYPKGPEHKMQDTNIYILAGIFGLVVIALIGLSVAGAPKYPAGYPKDRMTSSQ